MDILCLKGCWGIEWEWGWACSEELGDLEMWKCGALGPSVRDVRLNSLPAVALMRLI